MLITAFLHAIKLVADRSVRVVNGEVSGTDAKRLVANKIGDIMGKQVFESGDPRLIKAILEADDVL